MFSHCCFIESAPERVAIPSVYVCALDRSLEVCAHTCVRIFPIILAAQELLPARHGMPVEQPLLI